MPKHTNLFCQLAIADAKLLIGYSPVTGLNVLVMPLRMLPTVHSVSCQVAVAAAACFHSKSGFRWHAWIGWCVMQLQDVYGGQEQASAKDQAEGRQASSSTPQSSQVYFAANDAVMQVFLQAECHPEQALFALPHV